MDFINEKLIEMNEFLQEKKIAIIGVDFNNVKLADYLYNIHADDVIVFDNFLRSLYIEFPLSPSIFFISFAFNL